MTSGLTELGYEYTFEFFPALALVCLFAIFSDHFAFSTVLAGIWVTRISSLADRINNRINKSAESDHNDRLSEFTGMGTVKITDKVSYRRTVFLLPSEYQIRVLRVLPDKTLI